MYFRKKQSIINLTKLIGQAVAGFIKCALKLFTATFISSQFQSKTATIFVTITTEII